MSATYQQALRSIGQIHRRLGSSIPWTSNREIVPIRSCVRASRVVVSFIGSCSWGLVPLWRSRQYDRMFAFISSRAPRVTTNCLLLAPSTPIGITKNKCVCLFSLHHIHTGAWSLLLLFYMVFIKILLALYNWFSFGCSSAGSCSGLEVVWLCLCAHRVDGNANQQML